MRYSVDSVIKEINSLEDTKEYKREQLIKKLKRAGSISLAAGIIYLTIPKVSEHIKQKEDQEVYYNNQLVISEKEQEELYDLIRERSGKDVSDNENALILAGIISNPNLTEQEKQIFYKFVDLLDDNPYLDRKSAYDALRSVDIIYESKGNGEYSNKIVGVYSRKDNTIKIFSEDEEDKVKLHEIIHCIFTTANTSKLPSFLVEGVTELLTNEYFQENPFIEENSYPYEITIVKMLADIVGSDVVLQTYATGNINILKEALKRKMPDIDVELFIKNTDDIFKTYEEKDIVDKAKVKSVISIFDMYYQPDKDEDYTIDHEMYLYNRGIIETMLDDNPTSSYILYLMDNDYYTKVYFSKKLKEENSSIKKEVYLDGFSVKNRDKLYKKTI